MDTVQTFEQQLTELLSHRSKENGSNTPDFVLAAYLVRCLESYEIAVNHRDQMKGTVAENLVLKNHLEDVFLLHKNTPVPCDPNDKGVGEY